MRHPGWIFCLLFFLHAPVNAGFHRCTGEHGEPSYSQQPCGAPGVIVFKPSAGSARPRGLRASERAWLEQRRRRVRDAQKPAGRSPARSGSVDRADRLQAYRCRAKRRALDKVHTKLRRGYKPASGEKLRRRRSAYEDYLATFCS